MTYDGFDRDRDNADQKWTVTADATLQGVRYVEAEAGTGSRYAVVVSPLPVVATIREGGPMLVTVLAPWQDAWPLASDGYLDPSYIAEHLTCERWRDEALNGGDLQALYLTVRHALGRGENHG